MVRFSGVHLTYGNGTKAIKGIDFRVDDGEFIFLIGPSGSGKSTIVKLITGELRPTHGRVIVNGFNVGSLRQSVIPKLRRTVGVIFQDFRLIEKKTVYENVEFAMRVIGADRRNIKERVPVILDLVGLSHKKNRFPHELSGGRAAAGSNRACSYKQSEDYYRRRTYGKPGPCPFKRDYLLCSRR